MKRKYLICFFMIFAFFLINIKEVKAFDKSNYENRNLCGNFEVAGFHSDGQIVPVSCNNTYEEAKSFMQNNGADDLAIMTRVNGKAKIIDANVALADLSINTNVNYITFHNTVSAAEFKTNGYTYMNTTSTYGGVDAGFIGSSYYNENGSIVWVAKVRIANYTGWIHQDTYELVPITWIKSKSSYTVSNDSIRHNYVSKIQNDYSGGSGRTIGPKPTMLSPGTYYSYDGHYFYNDLTKLIKDYRNNSYSNSVNKDNKYYNYYMYLSNHSKTTYSSINLDEYIRNNMGYRYDAYGTKAEAGASKLYGKGTFFYHAQEKYGANALLSLSLSRNETGNGTSSIVLWKNNGFGLNAYDQNPGISAGWYASFETSILSYADKWITNKGYAYAEDGRYFGPQFGDKFIGMNVRYASDPYWSEKMASNYYDFDRSKGLQDYNYYQLGVITEWATQTYSSPSTSAKKVYKYPEPEDAVLIVSEVTGTTVNGNNKWYGVMPDVNLNDNYDKKDGDYNWNKIVYVPACYVRKINQGKNGYISPNSVTEYKDSKYSYDLLVGRDSKDNAEFQPKVGISIKKAGYHYEPTLDNWIGLSLEEDRYVMIYNIAYDENKKVKSYQVSSDHMRGQKHWVDASAIQIVNKAYGRSYISLSGNQYTWVNSKPEDTKATLISGFYDDVYFPVLEELVVDGKKWYKVPVDLANTNERYGWTLAEAPNVQIKVTGSINQNNAPTITANNKSIVQGTNINLLDGITAHDAEDGDLTSKIKVSGTVNKDVVGEYKITYSVTDSSNSTTTKEITIKVTKNNLPVIEASDLEVTVNHELKENYKATDIEDGDITSKVKKIKNNVNVNAIGEYEITYSVTDSYNQTVEKTIKVKVVKDENPVIIASNKTIAINEKFNAKDGVTAEDKEDGNLTSKITVIKNTVDTSKKGTYEVTYQVKDSADNTTTLTIKVEVVEKALDKKDGYFFIRHLNVSNGKIIIQGYQTILGINNNLDTNIVYKVNLVNTSTNEEKEFPATRITNEKDIPTKVYSPDGKDYTYSWFNFELDVDNLSLGDYKMYISASTKDYYSESLIVNKTYSPQATYVKSKNQNAIINNNYSTKNTYIELKVREEVLIEKTSSYTYNQYDQFYTIEFTNDNKLHLRGNSYSYGMDLNKNAKIERKIIFEDSKTFKTYRKDLGSIIDGNYPVKLPVDDKLDKTRAWYDTNIDISDLPVGNYIIYISTKANINDVYQFTEMLGRSLDNVKKTINGKNYSFKLNKEKGSRIELNITK